MPGNLVQVILEPVGRRIQVPAGTTLLAAAQTAGVELVAVCGGAGTCGTCRVRPLTGTLSPLTPQEHIHLTPAEIQAGWRLACQAQVHSATEVDIPPESLTAPQRLQLEALTTPVELAPPISAHPVHLPATTSETAGDTWERLQAAWGQPLTASGPVSAEVCACLRQQHGQGSLALRGTTEVVACGPLGRNWCGLAVDVGTTKVAAYLVDLHTGATLAQQGAMNPQIAYGEDVVSRIAYTNTHPAGRQMLQNRLIETLNQLVETLLAEAGVTRPQIVEAVVVGNTAMHHLFAGLPVEQLGTAPYIPAVRAALTFPAREVGLALATGASVYLPPNIAGYVGADHVAMLLATRFGETGRTSLAVDIGTNTEISLYHQGRHWSCSCASGPAFEGARIREGMRAAPGAIERVQISGAAVQWQTIGNQQPVGVCGSGILEAVAEMLKAGVLTPRGAFSGPHPRLLAANGQRGFVLALAEATAHGRPIVITRQDVSEVQLAKGAIRAGIEIMLAEAGLAASAIETFIIAGAFGTYLDLHQAMRVGLFPTLPRERFVQAGNAAGAGARALLLSGPLRQQAATLADRIEYVELTTHPAFPDLYVQALAFTPY